MVTSAETIRAYSGSALFERGYRPFFLGAVVFSALALPLWLVALRTGLGPPAYLGPREWHVHEMVFGYLGAVIAGFLLTAIPNWTGRLPVAGRALALLAGFWLAGRVAMLVSSGAPVAGAVIDSAFLCVFAAIAWREVLAGRNRRNLPICVLVTLLAAANIGFHVAAIRGLDLAIAERVALAATAVLIMLVGGRIVPSFTRNWLAKQGATALPAAFGLADKLAMAAAAAALIAWIVAPQAVVSAVLFAIGAIMLALRLARWRGFATFAEPLVIILHIGYAWLPLWCALMALQIGWPALLDASTALHALTAGAIGTMTVAVMTRATLGHSGRPLAADWMTSVVYILVVAAAALRVLTPLLPFDALAMLTIAGAAWSAGFALFAIGYAPIFLRGR